jgi:hypothetical protein
VNHPHAGQHDRSAQRKPDPVAEVVEFKPYQGGYAVRFDYDPFLVSLLKKLPRQERQYVSDRKYWQVSEARVRWLADVVSVLGYAVVGVEVAP